MSGPSDSVSDVARELRQAVLRWDPDARLLGNVRAEDILRVCETASGAEGHFGAIDQLEAERDKAIELAIVKFETHRPGYIRWQRVAVYRVNGLEFKTFQEAREFVLDKIRDATVQVTDDDGEAS